MFAKRKDDKELAGKWTDLDKNLLMDLMLLYLDRCKFVY